MVFLLTMNLWNLHFNSRIHQRYEFSVASQRHRRKLQCEAALSHGSLGHVAMGSMGLDCTVYLPT